MGFNQTNIKPTSNEEFATQIESVFSHLGYSIKSQGINETFYNVTLSRTKAMESDKFDLAFNITSDFKTIHARYRINFYATSYSLLPSETVFTFNVLDNNKDDYIFGIYCDNVVYFGWNLGILTLTHAFNKTKRKIMLTNFSVNDEVLKYGGQNVLNQRNTDITSGNTSYMVVDKRFFTNNLSIMPETFDNCYNVLKYAPRIGEVINFEGKNLMILREQCAFNFD